MALSAARGVTQVMERCEEAKASGHLDLSNCSLMYIADAIYLVLKEHCTAIHSCSLKNNQLKKFPKKLVEKFPDMAVLNLEGNQLEEVPAELASWSHSLRGINLARNRLATFPEVLFDMGELALLDLSLNAITDAPDTLFTKLEAGLPKLKQLNLQGNPIAEVYSLKERETLATDKGSSIASRRSFVVKLS